MQNRPYIPSVKQHKLPFVFLWSTYSSSGSRRAQFPLVDSLWIHVSFGEPHGFHIPFKRGGYFFLYLASLVGRVAFFLQMCTVVTSSDPNTLGSTPSEFWGCGKTVALSWVSCGWSGLSKVVPWTTAFPSFTLELDGMVVSVDDFVSGTSISKISRKLMLSCWTLDLLMFPEGSSPSESDESDVEFEV